MTTAVRTRAPAPDDRRRRSERAGIRPVMLVAAVLVVVIWADQTSKGWAWRHLTDVHVNSGGNALTGTRLSGWLRDPVTGALLDVVDAVLLAGAAWLIVRARRGATVTACAALALAGWSSNLLDRLGMHDLTAPGSVRGAVDFIPWGGHYWNLADVAIVAGSTGFALALIVGLVRGPGRPRPTSTGRARRRPARAGRLVISGVLVVATFAAYGAAHYSGVDAPTSRLMFAR